mgnify:CR=1 FL=1
MEIEIEGIKYRMRNPQPHSYNSTIAKLMMMATYFGGMGKPPKKRPEIDIIEEFRLIQKKESKLSRNDRDWVLNEFERHFEKI